MWRREGEGGDERERVSKPFEKSEQTFWETDRKARNDWERKYNTPRTERCGATGGPWTQKKLASGESGVGGWRSRPQTG